MRAALLGLAACAVTPEARLEAALLRCEPSVPYVRQAVGGPSPWGASGSTCWQDASGEHVACVHHYRDAMSAVDGASHLPLPTRDRPVLLHFAGAETYEIRRPTDEACLRAMLRGDL